MSHHPDQGASRLNASQREAHLAELRDGPPFDVLVVGGGVVGTGVALDAAARGLRVALIERRDLAWGTSRWSSKLVHGGLRYLAQGAVDVALECAREREVLMRRTAPHLVRPIAQVIPLGEGIDQRAERLTRVGLSLGDVLRRGSGTRRRELPRARRIGRAELTRLAPGVRREGLRGGLMAWDAQLEDDARLVVALARTAALHGAKIITHCAAEQLSGGGAQVRDELSGARFDVRARSVINATGVWAGELAGGLELRPSLGTHLVVRLERLGGLAGMLSVPVPGESGRWVFAIGQRNGLALLGLTDTAVSGPLPDVPQPRPEDAPFLLETISSALARPLTSEDVVGSYAGLRPLIAGSPGVPTADLSRRHAIVRGEKGLVSVIGGKLTTYRRIAQNALDVAIADAGLSAEACRTRDLPLVGAAPRQALGSIPAPARLVDRHGTEAPAVLSLAGGDPDLLAPVAPGLDVLLVEVLHALRSEGALSADDVLDRRTRIGLVPADRARAAIAVRELVDAAPRAAAA